MLNDKQANLRQHFEQPQAAGLLKQADVRIEQQSAAWGDEIVLTACVKAKTVTEIGWLAAGRPELIAAISMASVFYLEWGSEGLLNHLTAALPISADQRYLLLLIEDVFAALDKNIR